VTTKSKGIGDPNHVTEARRILVAQRTIRESDAYRIFTIPSEPSAGGQQPARDTLEMVALLQQSSSTTCSSSPMKSMDCSNIHIAITPVKRNLGPPRSRPSSISDTGASTSPRSRDHQTGCASRTLHRPASAALFSKQRDLDTGVNRQYKELFQRNIELDTVINLAHEGILLLDNNERSRSITRRCGNAESRRERGRPGHRVFAPEIQEILTQEQSQIKARSGSSVQRALDRGQSPVPPYFGAHAVHQLPGSTYIRQLEQT